MQSTSRTYWYVVFELLELRRNIWIHRYGSKICLTLYVTFLCTQYRTTKNPIKAVREYDQEMPQLYTADQPAGQWGRDIQHLQAKYIEKTIMVKQPALAIENETYDDNTTAC